MRREGGGIRIFFPSLSRSFLDELAAIEVAAATAAAGIYESAESIGDKSASSPGKDAAAAAAVGALIDDLLDPPPSAFPPLLPFTNVTHQVTSWQSAASPPPSPGGW